MQALDFDLAIDDLRRSVELLRGRDDCNGRVASVGYCMGGVLSFLSAANAGVDAAVCYYPGSIEKRLDQAERITCPTLFHFAEEDDHIDSDAVAAVQEKMAQVGQAQIETYPRRRPRLQLLGAAHVQPERCGAGSWAELGVLGREPVVIQAGRVCAEGCRHTLCWQSAATKGP
jgi:dienelactone hydrolase